ncbi:MULTISPECIES: amidase [unclassified Mesorhizobium]|uniref:amidase n=2 Tax=Mesorhizobium TaxID=68287 RepID=UPI000F7513EC|nr:MULTISPECIES: amidase [unclassified Mesorhizobium]TGT56628.1 amidase [Mesorhizobium sp. M00.F.Ca.ET.170.01.1.1]AZO11678.1 amidase [Mesorhizobium sp. M3A.F.Ca.ET.080.04.2.1]RWB72687.1 MAG: amidase [Mesorhizobium sp.]RWB87042.1 MAG: amidase [Mesorhizobium sp.]RWE28938.1 MAG: amidase [Mesorhizobium sp.]
MPTTHGPLNAFLDLGQLPVINAESGPLAGLRLAIKDIYDVAGFRTGCGNPRKFEDAAAASQTAAAVQVILDAGARFVGKTQTDELAFSLMGQNAHFPFPVNPAAPERVTGGSSSGSAAAVAGGLADIAVGSDTGGSIRAPASFCGLIGLRATHGRISLDGAMKLAPSFDTFGWFARDIDIYERVGKLLLGADPHQQALDRPLSIGWLDAFVAGPAETGEYGTMKARAADVFGETEAVDRQFASSPDELYWCFRRLQAFEAWQVHGEWISSGDRGLGLGVDERFAFGRAIDAKTVETETARRLAFRSELADLLGANSFLVLPTVPGAAPLIGNSPDQLQAYRERALHLLCLSGLSGFPQITLPLGSVDGAPFGLSLLGPSGSDMALIRLGRKLLEAARKA